MDRDMLPAGIQAAYRVLDFYNSFAYFLGDIVVCTSCGHSRLCDYYSGKLCFDCWSRSLQSAYHH